MRMRTRSVSVLGVILVGVLATAAFATAVEGDTGPASRSGPAVRQPVDLVWISDSSGWEVASFYARQIRKDLGVKVRVHDMWEGNLTAAAVLERLREKGHYWIPLIRNAEVIFVTGNPYGLRIPKGGNCVTDLPKPPAVPQTQGWSRYIGTLKAINKRIFEIRKGQKVILRTGNWYVPVIAHAPSSADFPHVSWEEAGLVDECTKEFEAFAGAIAKAAAAYRVPVADVYTAFNGIDHREDPVAKGYIQTDGIHPNDKGRAVIAKTLAGLGYKQVKSPR